MHSHPGPEREEGIVRGHVRRRRTWEFIVDVGPHPVTGRRRQKSKSGFSTRRRKACEVHLFDSGPDLGFRLLRTLCRSLA